MFFYFLEKKTYIILLLIILIIHVGILSNIRVVKLLKIIPIKLDVWSKLIKKLISTWVIIINTSRS